MIATKVFFAKIAPRKAFCKDRYKKDSLQGLLQEGFFVNLLQGLLSLWMQAKNQSQHHVGKNNSNLIWYKNTNTNINTHTQTKKDGVVDQHIHVRIIGYGEGCPGDWDRTRKIVVSH
jgi:hypothetical protein